MRINRRRSTYVAPFKVIEFDAFDAYYYADIMGQMNHFDTVQEYGVARDLADALFTVRNYKWESLEAMNDCDGGWDVRVFDANNSCVYAAHMKYKDKNKWIGGLPKHLQPDARHSAADREDVVTAKGKDT